MVIVCLSAVYVMAQNKNNPEVFAGFSVDGLDTGLGNSSVLGLNNRDTGVGFDTSVTGFVWNKLGIEGDLDGHYKGKTITFPSGTTMSTTLSSYNFMGGPHYKFSSSGRVTPFVHALLGGNHSSFSNSPIFAGAGTSETDFAMKFGGGVDLGLSSHTAFRVGADYNPIFQKADGNLNPDFGSRRTRNDLLLNLGIVFK
jgi:hypothetical protein